MMNDICHNDVTHGGAQSKHPHSDQDHEDHFLELRTLGHGESRRVHHVGPRTVGI